MPYAKHIIKKQIIELQMTRSLDRTAIQNRVSRIYQQEIVPLLDSLLSAKSSSSTLVVDRLEINIGRIPAAKLEALLAEKIGEALQESLEKIKVSEAQAGNEGKPVIATSAECHSAEELIIYFLQTGIFPWWAQATTYTFLEEIVLAAFDKKASDFIRTFLQIIQEEEIVKRLLYTFPDAVLEVIAEAVSGKSIIGILHKRLPLFAVFEGLLKKQQLREYWWQSVYQNIGATDSHSAKDLFEVWGSKFVYLTAQKSNRADLLLLLQRDTTTGILEKVTSFINHSFANTNDSITQSLNQNAVGDTYQEASIAIDAGKGFEFPLPVYNVEASDSTNGETQNNIGFVKASSLQNNNPETAPEQTLLANKDYESHLEKAKQAHRLRAPFNQRANELKGEKKGPVNNTKTKAETNKMYVQNAGLVLLWPFLQHFFQNLELANDETFTDDYSAEHACLLLQYLATGNCEEIFEAQLPLNKVLCGIPLLQPLNTRWTIIDEEIIIAENFLLAVIQNSGEGWKNLSVGGLRQAYLHREAILSGRDGNWLLQVKRETYDILVDRLPWTVQIVKLPWMERLVFVEW